MRQHGAAHHVAHRPDVGQVGLAVGVHHDGAALVELQAHGVCRQAGGVGHTANRDDQLVNVQRHGFALGVGVGDRNTFLDRLDLADLDAELDLQALLDKSLVRFLGDLLVHRTQKGR